MVILLSEFELDHMPIRHFITGCIVIVFAAAAFRFFLAVAANKAQRGVR